MKFLSRLLGEHRRRSPPETATTAADHIAHALAASGLDRPGPGSIHETIERALAGAGLKPGRAPRDTRFETPAHVEAALETPLAPASPRARGQFLQATFANAHGRRDYRLYLPADYDAGGAPRPLVVMLHGCTQSAEDFAVGTRMNALADVHGFLVAYPQQIGKANHAKCWNWFRPEDQRGDAGEPSIIAGIAQRIAQEHRVDTGRIFVAGLSAGAAMAVVLGRTHPGLVRAIGVHSGLPYRSAHDVPSAFAAMQGRGTGAQQAATGGVGVPLILFHGDQDRTVAASNADALAVQALRPGLRTTTETGRARGGQAYTRQVSMDEGGAPWFERWTVHGAGHAWSGGDPAGTYTDAAGPDASEAMVEFFMRLAPQPRA